MIWPWARGGVKGHTYRNSLLLWLSLVFIILVLGSRTLDKVNLDVLGSPPVVATWDFTLHESRNISSSPSVVPDMEDLYPEAEGTEAPSEDYQRIPVSPTNMHVFLEDDLLTDNQVVTVEAEEGKFPEQATTSSAGVTARVPVTHHTSTLRITTSRASSTVGILEPHVHHNVYHGISHHDKEEPANDIEPTVNTLDATSSTTTSLVLIKDTSSQPEKDILSPEDGSGDPVRIRLIIYI